MRTRYFGYYPAVNVFISKAIFWALGYRRWRLKNKYSNFKPQGLILKNSVETQKKFIDFIQQGFVKINLGGGTKNFEGFINIDFIPHKGVKREVIANILDLSFIPDTSLLHIHSNHVVEHLTQGQFENQLKEYKRALKKDGIISIRCPNILGVSYGFFFGQTAEKDHNDFLALGYPAEEDFYNPADGWYYKDLWGFYHWVYAYTGNIENQHLNQYTPTKIKQTIESAGFTILKQTDPETSNIVVIARKT